MAMISVLDTGLQHARWNVAMTAALVARHADGKSGDMIRFHRYLASVLFGRGEDAAAVVDLAYCRQRQFELARRVTGGGAIFMTPRMLAWDVIVDRHRHAADLSQLTERLCTAVANGLLRLGVAARYRAPNDIEIGGRKVAGTGGYSEGRSAVLQGVVLIDDDISEMALALRSSEPALQQRLTCLAAERGASPALHEVTGSIETGLLDVLGGTPQRRAAANDERDDCETMLRSEIGSDEFVFGSAPWPTSS
jgi:lipoate---protein ligase